MAEFWTKRIMHVCFFVMPCFGMDQIPVVGQDETSVTFQTLCKNSEEFHSGPGKFVKALPNKIQLIAGGDTSKQQRILEQAKEVRPIFHPKVATLMDDFLEYKKKYGNDIEKNLYKNMKRDDFLKRLLTKRPLMFMGESDLYLLKDGVVRFYGAFPEKEVVPLENDEEKDLPPFEKIGTILQEEPFVLNNYISYDEMQISALIGVSVPTFFINNGCRNNRAKLDNEGSFEEQGVFVGLVGARFEKKELMEWQHMIVTSEQNTAANGYGVSLPNGEKHLLSIWSKFYEESFQTHEEAWKMYKEVQGNNARYCVPMGYMANKNSLLDCVVYKKRMEMVLFPFLWDANERAKKHGAKAYCHVVGLGLGVWRIDDRQRQLMVDACGELIKSQEFSHIADVDFAFIDGVHQCCNVGDGGILNGVKIHFSKRNPADKLIDQGKLLVAMYAWDGNAYPGNEYWYNQLSASGDPAAACCSTISELQNPDINPYLLENAALVSQSTSGVQPALDASAQKKLRGGTAQIPLSQEKIDNPNKLSSFITSFFSKRNMAIGGAFSLSAFFYWLYHHRK